MPPDVDLSPSAPRICILLALYRGEAFLQEQLDSYAAQTHVNWSVLASDDGSQDSGPEIFRAFAARHPAHAATLLQGPGQGFARNFLFLLQNAPQEADFVALSDQDDVWYPDKLERALRNLADLPAGCPGLYCARTTICREDLSEIGPSPHFPREPDFRNALVQSIGGGNTMVLNRSALNLVQAAAARASDPVAHDWWLYQLITGYGGRILRDPVPVLAYRQHGRNAIGTNRTIAARLARIAALAQGRFRDWNTIGLAALDHAAPDFTPEARATLDRFKAARSGPALQRLRHLRRSDVYRQSRLGTLALYLACLLNRL